MNDEDNIDEDPLLIEHMEIARSNAKMAEKEIPKRESDVDLQTRIVKVVNLLEICTQRIKLEMKVTNNIAAEHKKKQYTRFKESNRINEEDLYSFASSEVFQDIIRILVGQTAESGRDIDDCLKYINHIKTRLTAMEMEMRAETEVKFTLSCGSVEMRDLAKYADLTRELVFKLRQDIYFIYGQLEIWKTNKKFISREV
jgi:hypothetical protein